MIHVRRVVTICLLTLMAPAVALSQTPPVRVLLTNDDGVEGAHRAREIAASRPADALVDRRSPRASGTPSESSALR
jgi:hypothetical protein